MATSTRTSSSQFVLVIGLSLASLSFQLPLVTPMLAEASLLRMPIVDRSSPRSRTRYLAEQLRKDYEW
jgi:hypothetical protein